MAHGMQLTFDASNPPAQASFWAVALGYVEQPPPPGFDTWEDFATANNVPAKDMGNYGALMDPDGVGPRLLFLKVPEHKTAKNRVHLDVHVPDRASHVSQLVAAGATERETLSEFGVEWTVMEDPEGNEFCVAAQPLESDQ